MYSNCDSDQRDWRITLDPSVRMDSDAVRLQTISYTVVVVFRMSNAAVVVVILGCCCMTTVDGLNLLAAYVTLNSTFITGHRD
jgi:hypothetical protein